MSYYLALYFIDGALHRAQRSADTQSGGDSVNTSSFPYIEVLRGRDERDGRDGVPGPRGPQGQRGDQGVAGPPGPRNGAKVPVQVSQAPLWCMQGGLVEHGGNIREEQPTISACLMIQTISGTHLESKDIAMCMEQSTSHITDHSKLFTTTMSPVLCATLQQGWQSP